MNGYDTNHQPVDIPAYVTRGAAHHVGTSEAQGQEWMRKPTKAPKGFTQAHWMFQVWPVGGR